MNRGISLYGTSVGKKVVMGLSGLLLFGFTVGHMLGNLKAFQGRPWDGVSPHALDLYGEALRNFGYPFLPHYGLLWIARIGLLLAVGVHIVAAFQLWRQSRRARPVAYRKNDSLVFSYASRTMRWGGVIILAFIVFHLLHMTTGQAHPEFEYGAVYRNLVIGFQSPLVAGFYLVAVGALCLHLYHGLWSVIGTLGIENPRIERVRRPVAGALSIGLFIGYAVVPIAVLTNFLTLP